jgi:O-antigen ligase
MAGYMIVSLFAALWLLRQEKKNPSSGFRGALALCAVVTSLISMFFSENRATLLGLGITTVALSCIVLVRRTKDVSARAYTKPAVLILSVLLVFGLFFGTTRSAPFWQHVPGVARFATTTRSDGSLNSRILFVTESLGDFWSDGGPKRVLFGWGWDNYVFFWTKHYDTRVFYFDPAVADRAHDKFIDMLVMTGIVGLGVYLGIWWMFLKRISYKLRESFAEALPYLVFAGIYFFFLLATFDLVDTLIGFYALLAYLDYEKFS